MKIAQIVAPGASEYERKSQRVDFAALTQAGHQVAVYQSADVDAEIAHVYGKARRVRIPHVVEGELEIPEAVEEHYWSSDGLKPVLHLCGSFARRGIRNVIEQTYARLTRTRDDIEWRLFERPPTPSELAEVAVWVDPALTDDDRDGFVAEALVSGNVVVASRTTINVQRLETGRTGFLVPPNDPNELTHAILAALFKSELGQAKASAARQTISKFRPRQRLRALTPIYESLLK
jgi:glycosyltransferase involved in cell wall biosynthesis